jgi:hypothetical protein
VSCGGKRCKTECAEGSTCNELCSGGAC